MMKTVWKLKGEKRKKNKKKKTCHKRKTKKKGGGGGGGDPRRSLALIHTFRGFLNDCSFVLPKQCSFISLWFNPSLSGWKFKEDEG